MVHPQGWSPLFVGNCQLKGKTALADVPVCMARRQEMVRQETQVNTGKHRRLSYRMKFCLKHGAVGGNLRGWGDRRRYPGYLLELVCAQYVSPLSRCFLAALSCGSVCVSVWQEEKRGGMKMGQDIQR